MKPAGRRRSRARGEHINIAAPPVVVLAEGMTGSLAKPPRWRTGGAAFTVERARGPRRSKAPNEHGRLPCGMGSIRQRRRRSGALRALLC